MIVPRETQLKLDRFRDLVAAENLRQNLVASSTLEGFHERHTADSLQLLSHVKSAARRWFDIGSGAGLPGMVLAVAWQHVEFILIEPRAKRADFLRAAAADLQLDNVEVYGGKVQHFSGSTDVISARAVASLSNLLAMAHHLATPTTQWILPKGKSARAELAQALSSWSGSFELVESVTDPNAAIVLASNIERRKS